MENKKNKKIQNKNSGFVMVWEAFDAHFKGKSLQINTTNFI